MSSITGETQEGLVFHEQHAVSQLEGSTTSPGGTNNHNLPNLNCREDTKDIPHTAGTDHAIGFSDTNIPISVDSHSLRALHISNSRRARTGVLARTSAPHPDSAPPTTGLTISSHTMTNNMERFLRNSPHDPWTSQNLRFQPDQDTSSYKNPYGLSRFLEQPADDPWNSVCLGIDRNYVRGAVDDVGRLGLDSLMDHLDIVGAEGIPWESIIAVLLE